MKKKQLLVLLATVVSVVGIYLINAGLTPLASPKSDASKHSSDVVTVRFTHL